MPTTTYYGEFSQLVGASFEGPHTTMWDVDRPTLTLTLRDDAGSRRLMLHCRDVQGARLSELGGGVTQVVGLYAEEVSERGWEGVRWRVFDLDTGRIEVLCGSVDAEVLEGWGDP